MDIKQEGKELYKETRNIIKRAIFEKQLILFVGAGASIDSGLPLWSEAIDKIAETMSLGDLYMDNLKIPQYYYNERGPKEYTQFMRRIFKYKEPLEPTALHEKILSFQTQTIITTNYDNLIELAAEKRGEVVQVISQDIDLPYRKAGRELIKMHGDFEHNNFVLKEDDYLQYSYHFKLIETYVKSLIGSKVVLFMGYSLNDPDVKQIFTWVKDILKDDFQRAYLIQTKKSRDQASKNEKNSLDTINSIEKDYFKNLGVNIIYAPELVEGWDEKTQSTQLIEVLDFILQDDDKELLDEVYDEIKPFKELNYVYGKYLNMALSKLGICHQNNKSLYIDTAFCESDDQLYIKQIMWDYLSEKKIPKGFNEEILKTIQHVFEISSYEQICYDPTSSEEFMELKSKKFKSIPINSNKDEVQELIRNFDYKGLANKYEQNERRLSLETPDLYMEQAYISIFMNNYHRAYYCLKNAASIFYKKRRYVWYFIAEFNRKHIGDMVTSFNKLKSEELIQIKSEIDAIDLDKILDSFPDLGNRHNMFLRELNSYDVVSTLFYDVFSNSLKVDEEAKTKYYIFGGKAAYENLRNDIIDYDNYQRYNYIFLDRLGGSHSIFILYIRTILSSILFQDDNISNIIEDIELKNVSAKELTDSEIYIILRYLNYKEIKDLFFRFNIQLLPIGTEALKYVNNISYSLCHSMEFVKSIKFSTDIFWSYLELVAHIDISIDIAQKIFERLIWFNCDQNMISFSETINCFVKNVCTRKLYQDKTICKYAKQYIKILLELPESAQVGKFGSLVVNLSYLCCCGKNKFDDADDINQVFINKYPWWIVSMYQYLGYASRKVIKKRFTEWKPKDNAREYVIYCDAIQRNIIRNTSEREQQIYKWISNQIKEENKKQNDEKEIVLGVVSNSTKDVIDVLLELYLAGKIKDTETFKAIVLLGSNQMAKWLVDIEHYDYTDFDCIWLTKCREKLLKQIAHSENVRGIILKKYQEQYVLKGDIPKITDIIVKYFIIPNNTTEVID